VVKVFRLTGQTSFAASFSAARALVVIFEMTQGSGTGKFFSSWPISLFSLLWEAGHGICRQDAEMHRLRL
jgi:hypothetical protein